MKIALRCSLIMLLVVIVGCAPVPMRRAYVGNDYPAPEYQQAPSYGQPAPSVVEEEDGLPQGYASYYTPYVVDGPVYYDGLAYYPFYFGFPGSCFCVIPVRYIGGVWYSPGNVFVHGGHFSRFYAPSYHIQNWRNNGRSYGGHVPGGPRFAPHSGGRNFLPAPQIAPRVAPPNVGNPVAPQYRPQGQIFTPRQQAPQQQHRPGPQRKCPPNSRRC